MRLYSVIFNKAVQRINFTAECRLVFLVMLYVCLIISIIIAVAFLFIFFYVPSMTVTFDLSLKNIYKNSALMSFGELKHNIIATFGLFVIVLFCATILVFVGNTDSSIALIITTAILMFVLVPALASYVINASVYPGMYNLMTEKERRSKKLIRKWTTEEKVSLLTRKMRKTI